LRRFFNDPTPFLYFCDYLPFEEDLALYLNNQIPFTQDLCEQSLFDIGLLVL
jgi:hypothetical protein